MPRDTAGLGSSPFDRLYWGNRSYFLLLRVLRCFSSPRSPHAQRDVGIAPDGLPHSEIRRSTGICPSLRLFAACHVLLRLREPRHPPCALVSFRFILLAVLADLAVLNSVNDFASCICHHHRPPLSGTVALVCSTLVSFVARSKIPSLFQDPLLPVCHCALPRWRITESNR